MAADADKPDTAPLHNQEDNMLSTSETRAVTEDYKAKQAQTAQWLAREMEKAYCPCTGFMYNSLAGEKNVLVSGSDTPEKERLLNLQCKHLLAVLIAHYSQRLVKPRSSSRQWSRCSTSARELSIPVTRLARVCY